VCLKYKKNLPIVFINVIRTLNFFFLSTFFSFQKEEKDTERAQQHLAEEIGGQLKEQDGGERKTGQ